jgi:hypothetical protein
MTNDNGTAVLLTAHLNCDVQSKCISEYDVYLKYPSGYAKVTSLAQ